jgi:hypothetical protein
VVVFHCNGIGVGFAIGIGFGSDFGFGSDVQKGALAMLLYFQRVCRV